VASRPGRATPGPAPWRPRLHYRARVRLYRSAALALALVLVGCSGGDDPTVSAGDATTAPSAGGSSSPPPTASLATPPVSVAAPAGGGRAYLTGVQVQPTSDGRGGTRVLFEFGPSTPGYALEYVERPVTENGSGREVAVGGDAVLQVRMVDASAARLEGEKAVTTYKGPARLPGPGGNAVVTEVVDAGDFEGQLTWVIGLRQKVPSLTVTVLSDPGRLVLDLPAPPKS